MKLFKIIFSIHLMILFSLVSPSLVSPSLVSPSLVSPSLGDQREFVLGVPTFFPSSEMEKQFSSRRDIPLLSFWGKPTFWETTSG